MIAAQRQYAPHGDDFSSHGDAAFGRGLFRVVPEDRFDAQPFIHAQSGNMFVADARVDNRDELLDHLGRPRQSALSDSELVFLSYLQWGCAAVDHILGDFALANWDDRQKLLTLVRDATGQRPLHFHVGRNWAAFASLPRGLHAHPFVPKELNRPFLAGYVAQVPRKGGDTFFEGVHSVEPGSIVTISRDGVRSRRYWSAPQREIRFNKQEEYVEAFQEELWRATSVRTRRANGHVGSHLSAGLDSSAVAATASLVLDPEQLLAFTSAPRMGFDGPVPRGRIGDESVVAALTAARYPNMEHIVVRSTGRSPLPLFSDGAEFFDHPVPHACNNVWWSAIHAAAAARGVSVMLTGGVGNLTITADTMAVLPEFLRTGRWLRWAREAWSLLGSGPSWRGILGTSFAPWLPKFAPEMFRLPAKDGRISPQILVRPELQAQIAEEAGDIGRAAERSPRLGRWEILRNHDVGNVRKGVLGRWGLDERDPTADRRLADFCLSLPPDQLLRGGVTRRLARTALRKFLPEQVIRGQRGYQFADWFENLEQDQLRRELDELQDTAAAEVLDFDRLRVLVSSWPSAGWEALPVISSYRISLLRALSAGRFAARVCQ
jgi:asparagine synthase (glutamine-hydrolysing)